MSSFNSILEKQREFFKSNKTLSLDFRIKQLQILKNTIYVIGFLKCYN